jgi:hypothetical protein
MKSIVDDNVRTIKGKNELNILNWGCGNSLWAFALFPGAFITGVDSLKDNLNFSKINAKKNDAEYKFKGLLYDRDIQKKRTKEVINDFKNIGYICIDSGGFCPYPMKVWPLVFSDKGYMTRNTLIKEWYYSQFIVLQKPYK